jgi:hypothetical protein
MWKLKLAPSSQAGEGGNCPQENMKVHAGFLPLAVAVGVWLATALVRVENQRYAMVVGLCQLDVKAYPAMP